LRGPKPALVNPFQGEHLIPASVKVPSVSNQCRLTAQSTEVLSRDIWVTVPITHNQGVGVREQSLRSRTICSFLCKSRKQWSSTRVLLGTGNYRSGVKRQGERLIGNQAFNQFPSRGHIVLVMLPQPMSIHMSDCGEQQKTISILLRPNIVACSRAAKGSHHNLPYLPRG